MQPLAILPSQYFVFEQRMYCVSDLSCPLPVIGQLELIWASSANHRSRQLRRRQLVCISRHIAQTTNVVTNVPSIFVNRKKLKLARKKTALLQSGKIDLSKHESELKGEQWKQDVKTNYKLNNFFQLLWKKLVCLKHALGTDFLDFDNQAGKSLNYMIFFFLWLFLGRKNAWWLMMLNDKKILERSSRSLWSHVLKVSWQNGCLETFQNLHLGIRLSFYQMPFSGQFVCYYLLLSYSFLLIT